MKIAFSVATIFRQTLVLFLGCAGFGLLQSNSPHIGKMLYAQGGTGLPSGETNVPETSIQLIRQIGIGGVWKLGHPCPVTIRFPSDFSDKGSSSPRTSTTESSNPAESSAPNLTIEITTVDGDGVEVIYRQVLDELRAQEFRSRGEIVIPIQIGRLRSMVSVSLWDNLGQLIAREDRVLDAQSGLPPTQPMVLAIGNAMGAADLVRTSVDGSTESVSIIEISDSRDLPSSIVEYQAVDLVILSTSNIGLLENITTQQWLAIDHFIRRGGGCIVSLSGQATELQKFDQLMAWLPGGLEGNGTIRNPAALESLFTTDQPIQPFPTVLLNSKRGRVRLSLADSVGRATPWWITAPLGFGTIQIVTSDLGHTSFSEWKHRRLLWERLVEPYFDKAELDSVRASSGSSVDSYLGYNDLTGQLRATLEQFPGVRVVSFGQIAALLIGILILIGPLDYFITVRWLQRPQLSWPIAGFIVLTATLGIVWYYQEVRPDQILINTARIIDVDSQTGRVEGHQWSHIYSAHARKVSVCGESTITGTPMWLSWQGLPGSGLGGLQSSMRVERGMPTYMIDLLSDGGSIIQNVGISAAGTKSLYGTWSEVLASHHGTQDVESDDDPTDSGRHAENASSLQELPTVDQLEGEVVNPLDVDLRDTAVFYRRWFYSLKSRMPPGDRVTISSQLIPRDISRRLNRQQEIDGKLTTVRWDPTEQNQLDRLLELMMFHRAATGQNYTSLTHRYQPIVDHSNLLEGEYAILVGRLDTPPSELTVTPNDPGYVSDNQQVTIQPGTDRTWVRILIPVDNGKSLIRNR